MKQNYSKCLDYLTAVQIPGGGDGEPAKEDALARLMAIAGKNIITITTIHKLKAFAFFLNGHFISYCIGSQYKDILIMLEIFTMEKSTQSSQYFSTTRMSIAGEDWDAGANILQSLNQAQVR